MALYKDQFYLMDASAPPAAGTAINFVRYTLNDANSSNSFTTGSTDRINGSQIAAEYPGDTITINVSGVGNVTYRGTTFYLANGQVVFTPTDGKVLQNGTFVSSTFVQTQGSTTVPQLGPACFAAGTLLRTAEGDRPIEMLCVGDLVETLDHGLQPVRWIGSRVIDGSADFAPVRFEAGVIGNDRPLMVSPQHRVILSGAMSDLLFGAPEVLVPAVHLVGRPGVTRAPMPSVRYLHVLFDRHEIVLSDGAPTESFHPGGQLLAADRAIRSEISVIFPDCPGLAHRADIPAARPVLSAYEARLLAA